MRFPLSAHTTYQDLLDMHRLRSIAEVGGTPFLKDLPHGKYWYARQRIGAHPVDRYIGPDSPSLRGRLQSVAQHRRSGRTSTGAPRRSSPSFAVPVFP